MYFTYNNHWGCLKDWLEFTFFKIIFDYQDTDYKYLEITILNFEFAFYWEGIKNV
jgi:hypothetical protein